MENDSPNHKEENAENLIEETTSDEESMIDWRDTEQLDEDIVSWYSFSNVTTASNSRSSSSSYVIYGEDK